MKIDRRSLLGVAGLVLAGSGTAVATQRNSSNDSISESDVSLTEQEARNIATGEVGGTVLEVELESEDGTPVYEMEVEAGDGTVSEVAVHADDGTVLEVETEDDEDENDSVPPEKVSMTEQEARDIATGEVEGTILKVELESEDGTPVYEVEVKATNGTVSEVAVHANDGTVLEVETEDDEDEDEPEDGEDDDENKKGNN